MAAAKKKPTARKPADMSGAVEPSVRTFVSWTTSLIRQAEQQADSGNLRLVSQLCDWLFADDRVQSALGTRLNALFGLDPTFEASGDKRRANRAVKALDAGEDWWAAYPESESRQIHSWGLLLGIGPARHTWRTVDGHAGRWLPCPEFWHPQHLRQDQNTKQWFMKVASPGAAQTGGIDTEIEAGDGEWILHTPYGKNRPHSMGLWRSLTPIVLMKALARQDWSQVSERALILVLTCLDSKAAQELQGYTKQARQELATSVYSRGRNAVAALPPGIDLKAVQAALKADDVQGALIDMADDAIAIVIRGGNLGVEVKEGSRAAAETQAKSGDLGNLRFDAQSWTTTAHDQSLVWWAEFNYGDRNLAPWPVYPVEPEEDRKQKSETEEKAFAIVDNAEKLGFEVDRKLFLEEYKISWAKPGERPPEPEPIAPGQNPEEPMPMAPQDAEGMDGSPEGEPQNGKANGKPAPAQARAIEPRAAASSGYDNGAEYADRLFERTAAAGAKAIIPTIAAVVAIANKAKDYDEARDMLEERYADMLEPKELASLLDAALTMGQLAGALGVREDVPELEGDA